VRLPDPPLLLVTDRKQTRSPLGRVVERALAAGCRWVSLREKDLRDVEQVVLATVLKPLTDLVDARFTLHGSPSLAKAAGLDGVHLPSGADAAGARAAFGTAGLIGMSVHSAAEAGELDPAVVDYVVAGPTFETASKPGYGPSLGARGIAVLSRVSTVPVIAIGGINAANVAEILDAGAAGIAVMGGVMRAPEPELEVKRLLAALRAGR
jgi:thiamine-phosphate pyrophosphorylase